MAKEFANVRVRATDDTGAAFDSLKRRVQDVDGAFGKLKGMLAGLGVGLSVGAFAAIVKSSIDAADHLNDLRKITGMTVEAIGGLGYAGRQAGVGVDEVAHGLSKLSKTMLAAATGNKEAAGAFGMLGVSVKDAGGQLRSSEAVFLDIAEKFSQMEDGAGKAAVAQQLFGKSGAQLIPMLNEGRAALAAKREEYVKYSGVTAEVAERADAFNDRLEKLKMMAGGSATTLASELLPAMDSVVLSLIEFSKESTAAENAGGALSWTLKGLVATGMGFAHVMDIAGKSLGAMFAAFISAAKGDYQGAANIFRMWGQDVEKGNENFARSIDKLWSTVAPKTEVGANRVEKAVLNLGAAAKDAKDKFADLMAELSGVDSSFHKDLQTLYAGFKQGRIAVEDYNAAVQELLETKTEAGKAFRKFREEGVKRLADEEKKRADQLRESIEADQKQLDAMVRSNEEFGKSAAQIAEMNLAKLELTRSTLDFAAATWEEVDALDKRIEIAKKMAGAAGQSDILRANDEMEKKRREAALRTAQTIESSLTDALLRGFESGKDFAANFRDTLVNMFKSLVLRPIVQFIVSPISGAITAALGSFLPGAAQAAGGGAGGGGLGGVLSNLGSMFGGNSIGQGLMGAGDWMVGNNVLPSLGWKLSANAGMIPNWQYGLAGLGGGLLGGMIGGKTGSTLGGIGGTIGMAVGGPIGAVIGSVGGGVLGKVFGGGDDKPKKLGYEATGTFGLAGLRDTAGYKLYDTGAKLYTRNIAAGTWGAGAANEIVANSLRGILDSARQLGLGQSQLAKEIEALRVPFDVKIGKGPGMPQALMKAAQEAAAALRDQFIPALQQMAQAIHDFTAREQTLLTREIPDLVRDVRGKLGIDTLLEAQRGLAIAEFQAPLDRVSAARSQLNEMFTRGMGGDLGAVNAFPALLQSALTIGRDVFASGSGFQEMFREGNVMLNELLTRQRALETDILADVPLTIRETSQDQIAALRAQTNAIVAELREVRAELSRLREAA